MNNARDTFGELRGVIDSNDPFMTSGHQIAKIREREHRALPECFESDEKIQELLIKVFPKLKTDSKQRKRAGRWAVVIQMYYRSGLSREHVAAELGVTPNVIHCTLKGIRRVLAGRRADNTGLKGQRRPGRPRKLMTPSEQLAKEERKEIS